VSTDREHLDAETVAAWIDGGLDAASLAAAEAHASNCDRCQALLATVAQTLPVEQHRGVNAAESSGPRSIWRWWMAPLAAATAAVVLWVVVPQDPMLRAPEKTPPASPAAPAAPADAPAAPVAPVAPAAPVAPVAPAARVAPVAPATTQAAESKEQLSKRQSNVADTATERDRREKAESALEERVTVAPAAPAPPAAPPVAQASPAPAAEAAPLRDAAPGAALGSVAQLRRQDAPLEIISPAASHRWRVVADMIEYSQDGGRSWIPVRLTAGDVITAGASPSPQVAWLIGRQGLVLLATDGTNFTRLPFPERVDLTAITVTDARRATVTTTDGRTFITDDNGRNWRNP
jgi:pyruvate/2-oxoglutarate dehydrogenase complex dihydrolipoamide acyltransferase (E2) component